MSELKDEHKPTEVKLIRHEHVEVLRTALQELRRVHDHISNAYDQLRTKALTMIGAEVALIAFIFSGVDPSGIKMPESVAGKIFMVTGGACLLIAFMALLSSIASSNWAVPGDMEEIEQIGSGIDNRYDTLAKFLSFLKKDYLEANRECLKVLDTKARRVNWGLYLLLAGSIILLVIKFGGHHS